MIRRVLSLGLLTALAAALYCISGCNEEQTKQLKSMEMSYYYTAELAYRDIKLKDGKLTVTYLPPEWKDPSDIPYNAPHYSKSDLKTVSVQLSNSQLAELAKTAADSGFMKLKPVYGARDGYRYYPQDLSVSLAGSTNAVCYRHGDDPEQKPMPQAFAKVREKLFEIAESALNVKLAR